MNAITLGGGVAIQELSFDEMDLVGGGDAVEVLDNIALAAGAVTGLAGLATAAGVAPAAPVAAVAGVVTIGAYFLARAID